MTRNWLHLTAKEEQALKKAQAHTAPLAQKLELAAVKYDARILKRHQRNARVYHNPHALGLYRARLKDVLADVARGASPREAIVAGFEGSLRQAMLRACGFPADWSDGDTTWYYRPVTKA
jgi:hypothetical protein